MKIICFDVNGTLVNWNSWDLFTEDKPEIKKEIDDIFQKLYDKEIRKDQFWKDLSNAFKKTEKANREYICNVWMRECKMKDGAEEVIKHLKDKGYKIYLISCSVDLYLECLVDKLGLDGYYAGSYFIFDDKGDLIEIASRCNDSGSREFKEECLGDIAEKEGVSLEEIIHVGDGDNDIGAFKMTKHGIAMNSDCEGLLKESWKQIKELKEIKEIL
ncbi:MAG: HAD-IB family phosphatase [Candidatus Pacebacteria bacterium]|nr:HAD-IB family phosphatase [Candidatus Paceibacterota bacterium]